MQYPLTRLSSCLVAMNDEITDCKNPEAKGETSSNGKNDGRDQIDLGKHFANLRKFCCCGKRLMLSRKRGQDGRGRMGVTLAFLRFSAVRKNTQNAGMTLIFFDRDLLIRSAERLKLHRSTREPRWLRQARIAELPA